MRLLIMRTFLAVFFLCFFFESTTVAFVAPHGGQVVSPRRRLNVPSLPTTLPRALPLQMTRGGLPPQREEDEGFLSGFPVRTVAFLGLLALFPGFFLGLFNTFFVLLFVIPPVAAWAFQRWIDYNVLTSDCPVCKEPVQALNSNPSATCFNCGTALVRTGDQQWRPRSRFDDDSSEDTTFTTRDSSSSSKGRVIDVEAETIS